MGLCPPGGWVGHAIILPTVCDVRGFVLMMMYNGVIKVTKAQSYNLLHMSPWQKSIDHWVEHLNLGTLPHIFGIRLSWPTISFTHMSHSKARSARSNSCEIHNTCSKQRKPDVERYSWPEHLSKDSRQAMATGEGVQAFCRYKDHGYAGSHPRPHPSGGPKIFVCDMFIPSNMI